MAEITLIDVSSFNGRMNFVKARQAGARGVMMRVGDPGILPNSPDGWIDPTFPDNVVGCLGAGLPWGGYWLFRPEINAFKQAEKFAEFLALAGARPGLPCAVDIEVDKYYVSVATFVFRLKVFLNYFRKLTGLRVMIYTRASFWNVQLGSPVWGILFPLWAANWTAAVIPTLPFLWAEEILWQYSADGNGRAVEFGGEGYPGGDRDMDLNRFNGTDEEFVEWSNAA